MEEKMYQDIVRFHTEELNKYPQYVYKMPAAERCGVKANFKKSARKYQVIDGILMYKNREVLTVNRLPSILHACHDNPSTGGHFGRDKTYSKIAERYYWTGMTKTIANYVSKCKICFAVNPEIKKDSPPLQSIPVPS